MTLPALTGAGISPESAGCSEAAACVAVADVAVGNAASGVGGVAEVADAAGGERPVWQQRQQTC